MKKLIYSLLIVTATICSMSACSSDEPYAEIDQRSKQIATRSTELEISDVVRNLNQSFGNTMTKSLETVYPDYYGGVYVNENGELVILVTEGSDNAYQKDLSQRCRSNNFITKQCKYSYNELFNIIKRLEAFQTNGANKEKMSSLKFYGFSLADNLNAICIQLGDISEENIAKFKSEVMDFPGIIFEKSAPISFEAFVNAGQDILGAIVYNESLQIAGIHDAGPTGGGAGYRYFISGKRIVSALGLTLY